MTHYFKKEIDEIPENPPQRATFLIRGVGLADFTHGIFKYPCKFIPHIPRWFLKKYSNIKTNKYGVLDPFMGSGTTLVESSLLNLPSYGIDVDPFSCLLSKVKTVRFTDKEIETLKVVVQEFEKKLKNKQPSKNHLIKFIPKFANLDYWFSQKAITDLATIKYFINYFYKKTGNKKIRDFLLATLASIIRKASFAEEQSPKPYISKKIKKKLYDTRTLFLDYLKKYFDSVTTFSRYITISSAKVIGSDARNIDKKALRGGKVHLVITSPPYINAFDYVRSLRLENIWLDLITVKDIPSLYDKQIGTEKILAQKYAKNKPEIGVDILDNRLSKIYKYDKKRAYVVAGFFEAMSKNLEEVYTTLIRNGYYCIVVGDSRIKGIRIPTSRIIIELAKNKGFKLINDFSYIIRNRYLRIPRMGRGGFIAKDYVLVFKK